MHLKKINVFYYACFNFQIKLSYEIEIYLSI